MEIPDNLRYTEDHEWIRIEDNIAIIGITDYAQEQLGDIVFVELPDAGEQINKNETFGAVESVKSVSDCFAPVSGKIVEINDLLQESPETLNEDCYGEGWMIKMEMSDPKQSEDLIDDKAYSAFVEEESE